MHKNVLVGLESTIYGLIADDLIADDVVYVIPVYFTPLLTIPLPGF